MTYNSGRPIPIEQQVYKTSAPFVGEVDGQVVGTFVIMDMTCTRGPAAAWKMGGIAGVAVLPEARQTGVGGAMMRWSLRYMREQGYVMAALYAFRESYYRKFGYEVCGMRYKITCPHARLPRHKSELPVRRILHKDLDQIKPCYDAFAKARSGMNLREPFHWGRIILDDLVRTIYAAGDPVEAYAIVEHDWTFWNDQPLVEFAWTTRRGYESILSFFAALAINKASLTWHEPSDSPFLARHLDQGAKIESEKPVMYRLLNPTAALETLGSHGEGEFSFAMKDSELPENNGPWQVCFANGKTRVDRTQTAELTIDPQTAVQAFLGQPSLADLSRNGSVSLNDAAARLLPPLPVFCIDYF
jgi:predicted acetyltransferase